MSPANNTYLSTTQNNLGAMSLKDFFATTVSLTPEHKYEVVDKAQAMLERFYVHLPLKRAMHAVEPIQRLKLLKHRLDKMSEQQFYDEMISTFVELRDRHTRFDLPPPYQGKVALLPVRIEEFFEGKEHRYIVTNVPPDFKDAVFKPSVIVTHWNGIPIDRAVEINAERQKGSNLPARHAQGLEALTARDMGASSLPDEEWVTLGYIADGQNREIRFRWMVFHPPPSPNAVAPNSAEDPLSRVLGIDVETEIIRRARKSLFVPEAMEIERRVAASFRDASEVSDTVPGQGMEDVGAFVDNVRGWPVTTPHGDFGYLRIRSFYVRDADAFVAETARIVGLLPQNGLIIDVRGNGGGNIMAGERLLQLFTPRPIEPERLHFINTPSTLEICKRNAEYAYWKESIAQAVETGSVFSAGYPVVPDEAEACNRLGQQYHGPIVLIIDALCYSTTDIFAAAFQDHEVGYILGTDGNTGAGGANVWGHKLLEKYSPEEVKPIPQGIGLSVAIRRTTRVGKRSGDPLEELGVVPDEIYRMTRNDVLNHNEDLITHAGTILAGRLVRKLEAEVQPMSNGKISVSATTANIARIDAYLDQRPLASVDVVDGTTTFEIPLNSPGVHTLELRGFEGIDLVAAKRIEVQK